MNKKSRAFSLIELTIALFLASLLILALTRLYLIIKGDFYWWQEISSNYRRGEFAMVYLERLIGLAGLDDCTSVNPKINPKKIIGFENQRLWVGSCQKINGKWVFTKLEIYLDKSGYVDATGSVMPSLFIKPANGIRIELIQGVSQFSVLYGLLNKENDIGNYVTADSVSDWSKVKSVWIALWLTSNKKMMPWIEYIDLKEKA